MKGQRKQFGPAKRFRFRLEYATLALLAWLVPIFPRRFVVSAGRALGGCAYWFSPGLRSISRQNLDIAFGDTKSVDEKRRIARVSLQNNGATLLALFWAPRLTRDEFERIAVVDADNLRLLRAVHARGKGMICIALHFGDWEMSGLSMGFCGMAMTVVQEAMRNERLEQIFARLRSVSGNRIVPNRYVAMTLLKTLKRGGNVALLVDTNATSKRGGVWLDFFGLPAFSYAAAGGLALHTGAPIIAGIAVPLPDGRVHIEYTTEIPYTLTGDDAADTRAISQACLRYCEDLIRAQPELWMWSYKRWTRRPTPEQGRYPAYSRYRADVAPDATIV